MKFKQNRYSVRLTLLFVVAGSFICVNALTAWADNRSEMNGPIVFSVDGETPNNPINLYTMKPDGSDRRQLTESSDVDVSPSWNSFSSKVAFERRSTIFKSDIYTINSNGTVLSNLTGNDDFIFSRYPSWSPDNTKIVYSKSAYYWGNMDIYRMDSYGNSQVRLTTDPGHDYDPSWASNGWIAFSTDRTGNYEIWGMLEDGSLQTRLAWSENKDLWEPDVSPDGTKIVYSLDWEEIWVKDLNSGQEINLTPNADRHYAYPTWSPDGEQIMFHEKTASNDGDLWAVGSDGPTGLRNITQTPNIGEKDPDWGPYVPRQQFSDPVINPGSSFPMQRKK